MYNNLPKSQSVEHDELKLNFRSTKGIVNLGQKILEFNDGSTGELLSQEAHREGGDMPFVVNIAEPDILRDNDDFGSRNAIIVANEQEKNKLKKQFSKDGIESERIFLFTEVKGLEFDQVLVWKFFEYFNGWRTNSQELERFKYNLLYVCTTRARERLYFYEGENANAFWQSSRIEKCISITDQYEKILPFFDADETVGGKIASAKKYEEEGNYLFAKEIYGRCNYQNDVTRMNALIAEEAKQFNEAAKYWEIAAVGYEKDSNWSDAENCWRKLSNWAKVAVACENQKKWLDAALEWKKVSDFEKAADNYCRIDSCKEAVRCLLEVENWQRIEEIYRKSSTVPKFADLCEKRENWKTLEKVLTEIYTQKGWRSVGANEGMRLASVQEKNGNLNNAIDSWLTYARNPEKAVELLLKQKKWQRALQINEEINNSQLLTVR